MPSANAPNECRSTRLLASAPAKSRAKLTRLEVVAIFQIRATIKYAAKVARMYGVGEKTIRDIWKRRTWAAETSHLEPMGKLGIISKRPGRPLGSRDTRQRRTKNESKPPSSSGTHEAAASLAIKLSAITAQPVVASTNDTQPTSRSSESDLEASFASSCHPSLAPVSSALMRSLQEYRGFDEHGTDRSKSLDEQLFAWEQRRQGSDP